MLLAGRGRSAPARAGNPNPDTPMPPGEFCTIEAALEELRAGVFGRAGDTEGSVERCRLAGLREVAVICEVLNADGTMARLPDLKAFCAAHGLKMCSIAELIEYRRRRERLIKREIELQLP